jgi:virginiamycin B lyase
MWFVELSGQMDGRRPDGHRIGRITMSGAVTEFPIPFPGASPTNIAVGPDRQIWFTRGNSLVRVADDGSMRDVTLSGPNAGATGLTAGSDRQPPVRLSSRLWFTQSGANKIAFLTFKAG